MVVTKAPQLCRPRGVASTLGARRRCRDCHRSGSGKCDWPGLRSVRVHAAERSLSPLVVLECDGVVVDLHTDGHRCVLRDALQELGLECANWTPEVYHDLIRSADGTEEGIIRLFFDKIGWPSMVATTDYGPLTKKIIQLKKKYLRSMLEERSIPLRPGVLAFVDACLAHDTVVAVLTETQSVKTDMVWERLKPLFGERTAHIQSIAWPNNTEQLPDAMSEQIRQQKRKEAEAFVSSMNARRREKQARLGINPNLLQTNRPEVDPSFFLSMAAALHSSVRQCVLVGAHNFILQAGASAGVLSVAVPAGLSARREFPGAQMRFDGFGAGGGLSWSRLEALLLKQRDPR